MWRLMFTGSGMTQDFRCGVATALEKDLVQHLRGEGALIKGVETNWWNLLAIRIHDKDLPQYSHMLANAICFITYIWFTALARSCL